MLWTTYILLSWAKRTSPYPAARCGGLCRKARGIRTKRRRVVENVHARTRERGYVNLEGKKEQKTRSRAAPFTQATHTHTHTQTLPERPRDGSERGGLKKKAARAGLLSSSWLPYLRQKIFFSSSFLLLVVGCARYQCSSANSTRRQRFGASSKTHFSRAPLSQHKDDDNISPHQK